MSLTLRTTTNVYVGQSIRAVEKNKKKKGDGISGLYGLGLSVNSSSGADFV